MQAIGRETTLWNFEIDYQMHVFELRNLPFDLEL